MIRTFGFILNLTLLEGFGELPVSHAPPTVPVDRHRRFATCSRSHSNKLKGNEHANVRKFAVELDLKGNGATRTRAEATDREHTWTPGRPDREHTATISRTNSNEGGRAARPEAKARGGEGARAFAFEHSLRKRRHAMSFAGFRHQISVIPSSPMRRWRYERLIDRRRAAAARFPPSARSASTIRRRL